MNETDKTNGTSIKQKGASKMAEGMAMHRAAESMLPEGERIFYDPYAVRFINPDILKFAAAHPAEAKEKLKEMEKLFPGLGNSIRARVRYFDDVIENMCGDGLQQLVILGAGYDTRAYRLDNLKENVRIFEVDHPDTQIFKKEKIIELFGFLPDNVVYVPVDFETDTLENSLLISGFSPAQRTLFILEGLTMYLSPESVDKTLSFVVKKSGPGSAIIFDYYPESVITGTYEQEIAKNILNFTRLAGEPLQFGVPDGDITSYLSTRGFSQIQNVSSTEYKNLFFHGKNADRQVCNLLSFVSAEISLR